jgi:hypothetical protein
LAIDSANPLIESDRRDALAASARAIASPVRINRPDPVRRLCRRSPNQYQ